MTNQPSILILGGYGTFGGRLVQLLADDARLKIFVAGRTLEKAQKFCERMPASATLVPIVFDREGDLLKQIDVFSPQMIVDASGPFQEYGDDPYRVIQACISRGVHYLDLSDASDFVEGVARFQDDAAAKNIFILSGVSSFPVLTAAVVRKLAEPMSLVSSITGGIAPSPFAGVGENVIKAIASYAGKPVKLTRGGEKSVGYGLTETLRYTIAPPGKLPLHNIRFSLVDVPDLQVIPELWPKLNSIWMGAGPVPEVLHRALNGLAWLVKLRLLPSLSPFSGIFFRAINILRWGEHRGGMFVEVRGEDAQRNPIVRSWHLLAEGEHGPLIPSMAVASIVRKWLAGGNIPAGARAATDDLELADYDALFASRTIYTGIRDTIPADASLYRRILGEAWHHLPTCIQDVHELRDEKKMAGVAQVERGKNRLSNWIANLFGFPFAGEDVPVQVEFTLRDGKEYWIRTFAGRRFLSTQAAGKGRYDRLICERFGPFCFGLGVVVENDRLSLVIRRWDFLGIALPLFLAPGGSSYEYAENDKFHFHINITLPIIGEIVTYRGWLENA